MTNAEFFTLEGWIILALFILLIAAALIGWLCK